MDVNRSYTAEVAERRKKVLTFIKYTLIPVAAFMLIIAVSMVIDLIGIPRVIKLEAGEELPSAAIYSGYSDARYAYDDSAIDVTKVGEYKISLIYDGDKVMKLKIKVTDTKAPVGAVKGLYIHNGANVSPQPKDFFEEIYDASDYEAKFASVPELSGLGSYPVKISLKDAYDNEKIYETTLNVIVDTQNPTIVAPKQVVGYVGEGIAYRAGVEVNDDCFGVTLSVDDSKVDMTKEGTYVVTYIATDAAGNKVEAIIPVIIHKTHVSADMLNERISKIAKEQGMTKSLTKEELCKKIYEYVNSPGMSASAARYQYVGHSNDKTRTDWRNEAYLTIQNGQGDCYSYFALSKAFFEYFGIESRDVERTKGLTSDTHFWSMVNIGTAANPRWYFFDATRYAGKFTLGGNNGCLMTAAQLESYVPSSSGYGDNYYKFDSASYPKAETEIINENYSFNR